MEYKEKTYLPESRFSSTKRYSFSPVCPEKKEFNFKIVSCISRYDPL